MSAKDTCLVLECFLASNNKLSLEEKKKESEGLLRQ